MITKMLAVKDIDASIKFYTEKLGFAQDCVLTDHNGRTIVAFVTLDGLTIGLRQCGFVDNILAGIDFMMYVAPDTDIERYYNRVQSKGVAIAQPLENRYWGERTFSLCDPDGHQPMFAQAM